MARSRKQRVELRKNRGTRRRTGDMTRALSQGLEHTADLAADLASSERISGKGDLTRKRTVIVADEAGHPLRRPDGFAVAPMTRDTWRGQVLHVHGLESVVQAADGNLTRCTTSRLLRTLSTEQRHPLAAGDWVQVRGTGTEAMIQAIEPRRNSLCRSSRGRRHVIVANVDQVVIVGSAAMPDLKPALLDRLLVAAESAEEPPVLSVRVVHVDHLRLASRSVRNAKSTNREPHRA